MQKNDDHSSCPWRDVSVYTLIIGGGLSVWTDDAIRNGLATATRAGLLGETVKTRNQCAIQCAKPIVCAKCK